MCHSHLAVSRQFSGQSCLLLYGQDASRELTGDLDWRFPDFFWQFDAQVSHFKWFGSQQRVKVVFVLVIFVGSTLAGTIKGGYFTLYTVCCLLTYNL